MNIKNKIEIVPLTNLMRNKDAKIESIDIQDREKLKKLMSMGVMPGIKIRLIQKFPSYVFQVGHSQFATDKELAECILVRIEKI